MIPSPPAKSGTEYISQPVSPSPSSPVWAAVLVFICTALCLFVVFRPFFTSHFDLVMSDPGDGRFEVAMLEHWTRSLHGQANLVSPNFFYPEKRVLGYSDALLGMGVPYAGLRSLGADRYLAMEFAMMLVTVSGFLGMYCLLLGGLRFAWSTALVGAVLFTVSNMYYIDVVHEHLNFILVAPWLFVFATKFWRAKDSRPAVARAWMGMLGLLLAVFFYTTCQMTWFLLFCSAAGFIFYLACEYFAERDMQPGSQALRGVWAQRSSLLLAGSVFLLVLIPFFMLYLPSLHRTGRRSLGETLFFMPRPLGMFDVGKDNLVWGRMSARIENFISPGGLHEHPVGWPLLTILLFLATALYCGLHLWRSRHEPSDQEKRTLCIMSAIALTCLTLWTVGVRIGERAPGWALLWKFVPGASAIRVPQRINLALNIGVVIVCMFGFETLRKKLAGRGALAYLVPGLLAGVLLVEQLNFMPTHLISRVEEARKFSRLTPPPKECSAFYVSNWSDRPLGMLVSQTDAMLVAQQYGIPTLNGYSSWFPKGWGLMTAAKGHVGEEAIGWAQQHGLTEGLCALDLTWGAWSKVDMQRYLSPTYLGEPLEGKLADPGFEDSTLELWAPYQAVRAAVSNAQAHSGAQSLAETEGVGSVYQDVNGLELGKQYRISAWVATSSDATAGAQIAVFDPGANVAIFSKTLHPGTSWQLLSDFVTVSQAGTLRIHLFRTEGSGTIYWDDVGIYLDKGAESSPAQQ